MNRVQIRRIYSKTHCFETTLAPMALTQWQPTVNLHVLNGINGFNLQGETAGDKSGYSVSGIIITSLSTSFLILTLCKGAMLMKNG